MTVQDVINASSNDFRQVLSAAAPDANLFISWVDRIQKDCLHTSLYNWLIRGTSVINVVAGTSFYTIPIAGGGQLRRIIMVYDRTFDRVLIPLEAATFPTDVSTDSNIKQALQIPVEMLNAETMAQYPKYYRFENGDLFLYPAPQKTAFNGSYEISYEIQTVSLANTTDTLIMPGDAIDAVVAGVNTYVAQFLHLDQESQFWSQQYEAYKKGQPII